MHMRGGNKGTQTPEARPTDNESALVKENDPSFACLVAAAALPMYQEFQHPERPMQIIQRQSLLYALSNGCCYSSMAIRTNEDQCCCIIIK